jgi:hypothetical protein
MPLCDEGRPSGTPLTAPTEHRMEVNRAIRYVVLVLSAAAVLAGVLILAGILVPRNEAFGDGLRIVFGVVIVLYGAYRFSVTWFRRPRP